MTSRFPTYDDVMADPTMKRIAADLETRLGGALPAHVKDALLDTLVWADTIPKQVKQWISNTIEVVGRIQKGTANSSDYSIAWIRLYELIEHLPDYFERYEWTYKEREKLADRAMINHIEAGYAGRGHLLAIVKSLSDDERITLEYERNCNAHILQTGYRQQVKVKDNNTVSNPKSFKGRPIGEVNAAIDRVLRSYKFRDSDFLIEILKRVTDPLTRLGIETLKW